VHAPVAGEVAVVAVDHRQLASTEREVEGGDPGPKRKGRVCRRSCGRRSGSIPAARRRGFTNDPYDDRLPAEGIKGL
jgi:hypothetical protein